MSPSLVTHYRRLAILAWLTTVVLAAPVAHAARGVFDLERGRPDSIVLMRPGAVHLETAPATRQQREMVGVLRVLDARGYRMLRGTEQRHRVMLEGVDLVGGRPLFDAHVRSANESLVVSVVEHADGSVLARRSDDPDTLARLDADRVDELLRDAPRFRGDFVAIAAPTPGGVTADLPQPYLAGLERLDAQTVSRRLYGGRRTRVAPVSRDLLAERLVIRAPAGYDPLRPAGLVVWVDPTDRGTPPAMLHRACDELNLVAIGAADSGNGRPFVDRMQLVLDAAASAQERYHIDPERIYLVGFSGGGRISSMMVACFPDVFAGAVPIGGLNHSSQVRTPDGKTWPKTYERPRGRRLAELRTRRVAAISGPSDFNYEQMLAYAKGWRRDGVPFRFIDVPGLGHELPAPDVMAGALRWIDEPWRERRAEHLTMAEREIDRVVSVAADREISPNGRRELIEGVTWAVSRRRSRSTRV
ncbi:MAG: PHB depolymerase family esterase, partial [Planctomycetota bacterium]